MASQPAAEPGRQQSGNAKHEYPLAEEAPLCSEGGRSEAARSGAGKMIPEVQMALSPRDDQSIIPLLKEAGFVEAFFRFVALTEAPPDLNRVLLVAANLDKAFKTLPGYWQATEAFCQWPALVAFLLRQGQEVREQVGPQVDPSPQSRKSGASQYHLHPLHGKGLERHALYAMLCNVHELERLRGVYAALQLQVLHARWAELTNVAGLKQNFSIQNKNDQLSTEESVRQIRLPYRAALSVRSLSNAASSELLEFLNPNRPPEEFSRHYTVNHVPDGRDFVRHFLRIRNYCERRTTARPGLSRSRGSQYRVRNQAPDCIEYANWRVGVPILSAGNDEDIEVNQEGIIEKSTTDVDMLSLGLDPLEVAGTQMIVLSEVPGAKSDQEALQMAHARTRLFEIDRRLFPWNSQVLCVDEIREPILPALARASMDDSVSLDDLTAATAVGICIETGRHLDDALKLEIERLPKSQFAFEPAKQAGECAYWNWSPIGPLYKTELPVPPEMEVPRATYLRYRSSTLVTSLIDQYRRRTGVGFGRLFRKSLDYCEAAAKNWLRARDPQLRFTTNRLSHLRWGLLHELTGGELASTCLVLGLPHPQARVELFYALLSAVEARELFEQSGKALWGEYDDNSIQSPTSDVHDPQRFVGCRAFPRLNVVQETVQWLREGSRQFFSLRIPSFDLDRDSDVLNRAVLYLVWHQFFSFCTRAICDAYLPEDLFSAHTGIGILSDKDFADGYKTRLIWASPQVRQHMRAVEKRLSLLMLRLFAPEDQPAFPIWLSSSEKKAVPVTPTSIAAILGDRFPFPANTPRKVMRYLLRRAGISHEHAEAYMGHWSHGREPWSPFSSFDFARLAEDLGSVIPRCLMELGFDWFGGGRRIEMRCGKAQSNSVCESF